MKRLRMIKRVAPHVATYHNPAVGAPIAVGDVRALDDETAERLMLAWPGCFVVVPMRFPGARIASLSAGAMPRSTTNGKEADETGGRSRHHRVPIMTAANAFGGMFEKDR